MATYSIRPELAKAFQNRFPNKASSLVEEYIKNMLNSRMNDDEVELDELREQKEAIELRINDLVTDKISIENRIDVLIKQMNDNKDQKDKLERDLEEEFRASCVDTSFYHKFKHKYIMSGAKDSGISELEYFRQSKEETNENNS